jgi:cytochrome c-type biogenesis protein CcmE
MIGGAVIIVGVFAYLLYGGIDQNVVYFLTPHELLAKGTRAIDAPVRLGGQVKPGSVKWNDATLDLRFTITDGARRRGCIARRAAADVPRRHGRRPRGTVSRERRFQLHESHGQALQRVSSAEAG